MRRLAGGQTGRLAAGVLAALLATLFTPSQAWACGHYVFSADEPQPFAGGHVPRLDSPPLKTESGRRHAPCSGPHCSGLPLWPAPEPAAPVLPSVEDWAALPPGPPPLVPRILFLLPEGGAGLPLPTGLFVYRPPRAPFSDLI